MNLFPINLKYLRKSKGFTQQTLADALAVKRPVIGAYEEGRAEPKLETLKKISDLFSISVGSICFEDLENMLPDIQEKNKISDLSPMSKDLPLTISKENPLISRESNLRILSITVDSNNEENIEWVPLKASAGYLNGYSDPEYLTNLQKFQLPMLGTGTMRAFEIKGDSMLPLQDGTFIIGEFVEDWHRIKDGLTYIVLSKNEGIVYKRVFKLPEENKLKMISDNQNFETYTINLDEILEIWKSKAYISTHFPK